MHTTNPATNNAAVAIQLNIFGGSDETLLNPPKLSKGTSPLPSMLHDGPTTPLEAVKPVKSRLVIRLNPSRTSAARANEAVASPELLVDPDEPISFDLEAIEASDTPETIMAKRMFLRMMWDIEGMSKDVEPDLFGQTSLDSHKTSQSDLNRLDALIWIYSLNPDGSLVSIEWVCDVLGFDPHRVRRIIGRSLRKELKRLVHLLCEIAP